MRVWLRAGFVVVVMLLALPFIVMMSMGVMKPAEGFCAENGFAQPRNWGGEERTEPSYFVSPELALKYRWWADDEKRPIIPWGVCLRSRQGEHRFHAYIYDRLLSRLDAPNLSTLHQREPNVRMLRIVTAPSFSRDPIAITLTLDEEHGGVISAAWLVDDQNFSPPETHDDPDMYEAWRQARLPIARASSVVAPRKAEDMMTLADRAVRTAREYWNWGTLDGTWVAIEIIENGERKARHRLLSDDAVVLFCALAAATPVPEEVLNAGEASCAAEAA